MLVLKRSKEPVELALEYGVKVTCEPLTTAIRSAAMAKATRQAVDLKISHEAVTDAGATVTNFMDLDDEDVTSGLYGMYFAQALAEYGILDWSGVVDEAGSALEASRENVRLLMSDSPAIADSFLRLYQAPIFKVMSEGNVSGLSLSGTLAGDRNTAKPAGKTAKTAAVKGRSPKTKSARTNGTTPKQPKARRSSRPQKTSEGNG